MGSFKENRALSALWDKLQSLLGYSGVSNPWLASTTIDEPLTLYVETTGNDLNPGTANRPFKTIQAALDWLATVKIASVVTVQVGVGSFDGFLIPPYLFYPPGTSGAAHGISIRGTFVAPTLSQGTATGTVTSSSSGVINDTNQNWAVNELKGKFIEYTTGGVMIAYPILSNTATSVTVAVNNLATGSYYIWEPATTINKTAYRPFPAQGASTLTPLCVSMHTSSGYVAGSTGLQRLNFDAGGTGTCIELRNNGSFLDIRECSFGGFTSAISMTAGSIAVASCLFDHRINNALVFNFTNSTARFTVGTSSFFSSTGATGATVILAQSNSAVYGTLSGFFNGLDTIVAANGASGAVQLSGYASHPVPYATNCGTILSAGAGLVCTLNLVVGSGVTTGVKVNKGHRCIILSSCSSLGTTEISLDGVAYTLAEMRANSPKLVTNTYGSIVYE